MPKIRQDKKMPPRISLLTSLPKKSPIKIKVRPLKKLLFTATTDADGLADNSDACQFEGVLNDFKALRLIAASFGFQLQFRIITHVTVPPLIKK